jgi:hypothetical protein
MSISYRIEPQRLAAPLYFIALLLIVTPLIDLALNIAPFRFGEIRWRYGTAGLLSGFLLTPLLGAVVATAAAMMLGQARMVRVIALVNLAAAVLLLGVAGLFVLDALQLRGFTPPDELGIFDISVLKAGAKHLSTAIALLWLGAAGLRTVRATVLPSAREPHARVMGVVQ